METTRFSVPNISCGHCVKAIQKELNELDGVSSVEGDPGTKEIAVAWESPATEEKILIITDLGEELSFFS